MIIFFNIRFFIEFLLGCFAKNARNDDAESEIIGTALSLIKKHISKYSSGCFWLLILFSPTCAQAEIYKTIDSSGKQHFSDIPTVDAVSVHLKSANTYSVSPATQSSAENKNHNKPDKKRYQNFLLTQPVDQQTFQNQSEILAAAQIDPALQAGDSIEWLLDGKRYQQSTSTTISLRELTRGEHTLQAKILDEKKHSVFTTQMVIFYIHQSTINK